MHRRTADFELMRNLRLVRIDTRPDFEPVNPALDLDTGLMRNESGRLAPFISHIAALFGVATINPKGSSVFQAECSRSPT